jgi:hypothetical protein
MGKCNAEVNFNSDNLTPFTNDNFQRNVVPASVCQVNEHEKGLEIKVKQQIP